MPTGCVEWGPGTPGDRCCDSVPAQCIDGVWQCDVVSSSSGTCESSCGGGGTCSTFPPTCYEDLGGGCCGEAVEAVCVTPAYSCPGGSLDSADCTAMAPECEGAGPCDALAEADCIGDPTCAPVYDDFCCPECIPIGACADCTAIAMYRCAPLAEACDSDVCGTVLPAHCAGSVPTCESAVPSARRRCSEQGCAVAFEPGCLEGCLVECVPVTADICTEVCDGVPPACPDDSVPERDGFCFTGRCIAASACIPPDLPTMPGR